MSIFRKISLFFKSLFGFKKTKETLNVCCQDLKSCGKVECEDLEEKCCEQETNVEEVKTENCKEVICCGDLKNCKKETEVKVEKKSKPKPKKKKVTESVKVDEKVSKIIGEVKKPRTKRKPKPKND